ncbi:MAG: hypothetical protein HC876_12200 [Chloroflexaceae bacterium]|nr:hypothetical protein [Chloroflexaceae bacterium]
MAGTFALMKDKPFTLEGAGLGMGNNIRKIALIDVLKKGWAVIRSSKVVIAPTPHRVCLCGDAFRQFIKWLR